MKLTFYDEMLRKNLNDYNLTEEQLRFTMAPIRAVEISINDKERFPVVQLNDDTDIVTFFVLHVGSGVEDYSDNEHAILLRAFSTDARFVGQGYAKNALRLLPIFVQSNFAYVNEIVLAVDVANEIAKNLYDQAGFIPTNRTTRGRNGEQNILKYIL